MAKTTTKWIETSWGVTDAFTASSILYSPAVTIKDAISATNNAVQLKLDTSVYEADKINTDTVINIVASNSAYLKPPTWGEITGSIVSQTDLYNVFVTSAKVGIPSGVCPLDSNGKLPVSYLYSSVMEYKGAWNATTNTPQLLSGISVNYDNGDMYRVAVSGIQDLGEGLVTYAPGDLVIYSNSGYIWQRIPGTESATVLSVNGYAGPAVVLAKSDIGLNLVDNISVTANYVPQTTKVFGSVLTGDILTADIPVSSFLASTNNIVLGRLSSGSGSLEELTIGTSANNILKLDLSGKVPTGVLYPTKFLTGFTSGQLVANEITINHNLGDDYPLVGIYNENKKWTIPTDITSTSPSAITISTSGLNVYGTWTVKIIKE